MPSFFGPFLVLIKDGIQNLNHSSCSVFESPFLLCSRKIYFQGWSVLLSRKALKRASKELREMCCWHSDVPSILSACLVSMEPDSNLRLMTDQYTPDERFGQTASNCQLSTPRDASCTHILVFPTSAKAQVNRSFVKMHQFLLSPFSHRAEFYFVM